MKGEYLINPENHKGIVFSIARKVKNSYPSVDINDIISEINILIMKYSSPIKNGERRTVCYSSSMGKESTFITSFIGKKIFQTIKYSGLVNCQSTMSEGKQVFEYINPLSMSMSVENEDEVCIGDSISVVEGFNSMYDNSKVETEFDEIISLSKNINDQEKKVLSLRFKCCMKLDEIGEILNITGERVRQIENKAISKLSACKKISEIVS